MSETLELAEDSETSGDSELDRCDAGTSKREGAKDAASSVVGSNSSALMAYGNSLFSCFSLSSQPQLEYEKYAARMYL